MEKLLLLHGAIGSENTFTALKTSLEKNFEIHTMNFPGHAESKNIDTEFSISSFSSAVIDYIDSKDIDTANIFGYSLGGYVALNIAHTHPQKIKSIMTFATIFNWDPENAAKQSAMINADKIEVKVPSFAKSLFDTHGENWKKVLSNTSSMLINLGNKKILSDKVLQSIDHKVCISVGDKDNIVSLDESIAAYRNLPNGELAVLPGTAHPFENVNISLLNILILNFFLNK